jgi:hypothetical protein
MSGLLAELPVRASALARMAKRLTRGNTSAAQAALNTVPSSLPTAAPRWPPSANGSSAGNATNVSRALAIHGGGSNAIQAALPAQGVPDQECRPNVVVMLTSHKTGTAQGRCVGGAWQGAQE